MKEDEKVIINNAERKKKEDVEAYLKNSHPQSIDIGACGKHALAFTHFWCEPAIRVGDSPALCERDARYIFDDLYKEQDG